MPKPRFSLIHNDQPIRNLNELRQYCDIEQLWIDYKEGTLLKWLKQDKNTHEKQLLIPTIEQIPNQIESINLNSASVDLRIIKKLISILAIDEQKFNDYQEAKRQALITPKADFLQLDQYLAQGKWEEADQETAKVMLKIMGREKEGWLTEDNCKNFPREELKIIDNLWVKYSDGKFGFSVQKKIWLECGGEVGVYDYDIYRDKFAVKIGWRKGGNWLSYSQLTFTTDAPHAHLPYFIFEGVDYTCDTSPIYVSMDGDARLGRLDTSFFLFSRLY